MFAVLKFIVYIRKLIVFEYCVKYDTLYLVTCRFLGLLILNQINLFLLVDS